MRYNENIKGIDVLTTKYGYAKEEVSYEQE